MGNLRKFRKKIDRRALRYIAKLNEYKRKHGLLGNKVDDGAVSGVSAAAAGTNPLNPKGEFPVATKVPPTVTAFIDKMRAAQQDGAAVSGSPAEPGTGEGTDQDPKPEAPGGSG